MPLFPEMRQTLPGWNLAIHHSNQSELPIFTQTKVGRARSHAPILPGAQNPQRDIDGNGVIEQIRNRLNLIAVHENGN